VARHYTMLRVYTLLLTGILIAATSSILVRWCGDVPPTVISFYRLAISFVILLGYHSFLRREKRRSLLEFHWNYVLAGFFLAVHLISWIASLQMTTIAHSIFLEGTHPVFAVIVSAVFLKEYPHKNIIPLFLLAFIGMALIVYPDLGRPGDQISGDALAILSALCLAFYLLIARRHRTDRDFIKYLIYIYGSAAFLCALYLLVKGHTFTGYSTLSWSMIILLALGPNLVGHSLLNWSSRHLEIFKVNMSLLLEPVLATIGGMIFFAEFPETSFYAGAGIIMLAVGLLMYFERRIDRE
jgi:drug/metabolite transporter (DMT)-like permease